MKRNKKLLDLLFITLVIIIWFLVSAVIVQLFYSFAMLIYYSLVSGDFINVFIKYFIRFFNFNEVIKDFVVILKYSSLFGILVGFIYWIFSSK